MSDLTPLEDALKIVLDTVPVLGIEKINLLDALGRVLAEDIIADRDNPPWDNSAMDGFAVRYQDIKQDHAVTAPTILKVIEDVPAGRFASKAVGAGEAIRIMTGAAIPQGADTVLKIEDTEAKPDSVKVFKPEQQGANIRPQGEDVRKGDCIIPKHKVIRPAEAGMLAILAKPFVFVYGRLRFYKTGFSGARWRHEFLEAGDTPRPTGRLWENRKDAGLRPSWQSGLVDGDLRAAGAAGHAPNVRP